jgi:hypothetical protein
MDSDTTTAHMVEEQKALTRAAVESLIPGIMNGRDRGVEVFAFVPEIEAIFFEAPPALERLLGEPVPPATVEEGLLIPRKTLAALLGRKGPLDNVTMLYTPLADPEIAHLIAQGPQATALRDTVISTAVTAWEPPQKWASQSDGWVPGSPPIANEWSVEARGGGICVVRIVHSLFASTDDWDNQLEGTESGWPAFLRTLRIYLTHFRGQRSATMKWMANVAGTEAEAWKTFTAALGVQGVNVGQSWAAPAGVPALSGVAEYVSQSPYDVLLRVDKPGPGVAALGAFSMGGQSMVALGFYLYGDQAAGNAAREQPLWDAWIQKHFPTPTEPSKSE